MSKPAITELQAPPRRSVLVTGANGYIGSAVARAFSSAGWRTYGLIRRENSAPPLYAAEVIPIIGSSAAPDAVLAAAPDALDVIVGTTEQQPNYQSHHDENVKMFKALAERSGKAGVRPLLIFTSGCKDYGRTGLDGDKGLAPHTEDSPLDPPPFAVLRANASVDILTRLSDVLDAVSIRPTPLWGRAGSYTTVFFELAENAAKAEKEGKGKGLYVGVDKRTVYHGCHVDDVGDAYVQIAEIDRQLVKGKAYNISGWRYETLEEIMEALAKEYGIAGGITWGGEEDKWELASLVGYSQWVGSSRIRNDTGWSDKRLLFSENVRVYRLAYEEARNSGDEGVLGMKNKLGLIWGKI